MKKEIHNVAYIDGANLHNGVTDFGWTLDYASLVKFLKECGKLSIILSPHDKSKCSILLKRINAPITYLNDVRSFFEKEKAPDEDKTTQGSFP